MSMTDQQLNYPDEVKAREMVENEKAWVAKHLPNGSEGQEVSDCQIFTQTAIGGPRGPSRGLRKASFDFRRIGSLTDG
jgi:hypothetical protein